MKLASVDTKNVAASCPLDGVKVTEVRLHDNKLESVQFVDEAGHVLVIACKVDWNNELKVLVKAPPEKVTKHQVSGELPGGVKVTELYDDEYACRQRKEELTRTHPTSLFAVEPIKVEVPD